MSCIKLSEVSKMKCFGKTFTGSLFHVFDQEIRQDIKKSTKKKQKRQKQKQKNIQYRISFSPQRYSTFSPNIAI